MFQWLLKADKGADLFVRWIAVLTALSTGFSYLSKTAPWFGVLNWSEAILLGIGLALITLFLVTASLALLRYFRPLDLNTSKKATGTSLDDRVGNLEETRPDFGHIAPLESIIEGFATLSSRVQDLEQTITTVVEDYQSMSGIDARLTDALDGIKSAVQDNKDTERMNREALQDRVTELLNTQNRHRERVLHSLAAICHREMLDQLASGLDENGQRLCTPTTEQARFDADQWEAWERQEAGWRRSLRAWCGLAEVYRSGVTAEVLDTPETSYKGGWSINDEQFPSSTAIYSYKTFRILLKNWESWRPHIDRAVRQVAFNGDNAGNALLETAHGK